MSDLISRQQAIDAAQKWYDGLIVGSFNGLKKKLEAVPPAQPEIIQCKDCKWFNKAGCAVEIVDDSDRPTENDFCSFAERREVTT